MNASPEPVYGTSPVKRHRRTRAEISTIHEAIVEVLSGDHPQSVRHAFYRLVSAPYYLVEKDEKGYRTVQAQLLNLRETGHVPWAWVSDGTRWRRQEESFDSIAEAIRFTAETYRRDLWRRTPVYAEVWCESDSLAGVLYPETNRYNIALMVSRGFSSKSFLFHAAKDIEARGRPAFLYYLGDWDPSGKLIPEDIEATLRRFAPKADIRFKRLLVTPEQIEEWDLPTKPAKKTTHAARFSGGTVEAEAIPANVTRQILQQAIEQHLNVREVEVMRAAEESEANELLRIATIVERAA